MIIMVGRSRLEHKCGKEETNSGGIFVVILRRVRCKTVSPDELVITLTGHPYGHTGLETSQASIKGFN